MHGDSAAQMTREDLRVILFLEASSGLSFGLPTDPPISELICSNERHPRVLSPLVSGIRDDKGYKESPDPNCRASDNSFPSQNPGPAPTRKHKEQYGSRAQLPGHVGSYLPPQLVVTNSTYPGSDECGVRQERDRFHGVSREVGAHRAQNDVQEGLCDHTDTQRGL